MPFDAIRQGQFRLYLASTLLFDIGQWAQMGIQAWLVLQLTASPLYIVLYSVSRFAPKFLLAPVAGVVADRVNRLGLLLASQTAMLAVTLGLAFLFSFSSGGSAIWGLLGLNALLGAVHSFEQPARRSLLPSLVRQRQLLSAVSLNNSVFSIAVVAGPIVAAVLLGAAGIGAALYLNAAMFALSLSLLLLMEPVSHAIAAANKGSVASHFWGGIKYLRSTPLVVGLLLVSMFPGFLDRLFVLSLPVLAQDTTAVARAGDDLLPIIRGAGAIAGALALAAWGSLRIRGTTVMLVALASAVASASFIFAPSLTLSLAVLGTAGLLRSVLSSMTTTMLHNVVPDGFRGRVMTI